jgi:hypothetical protein
MLVGRLTFHVSLALVLLVLPGMRALCNAACAPEMLAEAQVLSSDAATTCHDSSRSHDHEGSSEPSPGQDECTHGKDSSSVWGAVKSLEWSGSGLPPVAPTRFVHPSLLVRAVHRDALVVGGAPVLPVGCLPPLLI